MANVSNFSAVTPGAAVSGTLTDKEVIAPIAPPDGLRADGPRVTFHFAGTWDAGNTYVYYDVVKDNSGASWICKYPQVPKGTPLKEGAYWTRWADPNIEIEELYQTVQVYDARITEAQNNASAAKTTADNAKTAADNAQTAAYNAQTAADNAQTAADNAQTAADNETIRAKQAETEINNTKNNNILYTQIFIANSGNDDNTGLAENSPLKTLDAAFAKIKTGLTVIELKIIEDGTYECETDFVSNISLHITTANNVVINFNNRVSMYHLYFDLNSTTNTLTVNFTNGWHNDFISLYAENVKINVSNRYDFSHSNIQFAKTCEIVSNVSCSMYNTKFLTTEGGSYKHKLTNSSATSVIYAIACDTVLAASNNVFQVNADYSGVYFRFERGFLSIPIACTFNVTSMPYMLTIRQMLAFITSSVFDSITQAKINTNYSYIKHTSQSVIE